MPRKKKEAKEIIIEEEQQITEIIVEKDRGFSFLEVIIVMVITAISGIMIGTLISSSGTLASEERKDLNEFILTYNELIDSYYEEVDTEVLIDAAIEAMISELGDPNSVYITEANTEEFDQKVEGEYTGIGVEILIQNNEVLVWSVFENSPADKAGIKPNDILIEVDGTNIVGLSTDEVATHIKGEVGTEVIIKYIDGTTKEEKETIVKRDTVDIPSVHSEVTEINEQKIGEISVDTFSSNTYEQFKNQLEALENQEIDSLIIDLRSNPGGNLDVVLDMASLFLTKDQVVYQLETKGEIEKVYSKTNDKREYEIVVLTNGGSASASEILAAALQEEYNATIVGTTTYGKGTVQQAFTLSTGATIKYTIQKWLTPDGDDIDQIGITPDEVVELNTQYYESPSKENDNQYQKAIEVLTKN